MTVMYFLKTKTYTVKHKKTNSPNREKMSYEITDYCEVYYFYSSKQIQNDGNVFFKNKNLLCIPRSTAELLM